LHEKHRRGLTKQSYFKPVLCHNWQRSTNKVFSLTDYSVSAARLSSWSGNRSN